MKVIYTNTLPLKPEAGVCYRTAFMGVISGATSIEVDEDFPGADLIDQAYAFLDGQPLTVDVQVGVTPELQKVIDDAQAECEKVTAENTALNDQVKGLAQLLDVANARIAQLEAAEQTPAPKKLTAAEIKAAKAADVAKAAEQPQE